MVSKLSVAEYMRDVALATLLGPYGMVPQGPSVIRSASEGDYDPAKRTMAVGAGSVGYSYAVLKFLNYVQGPKYAMTYPELITVLNPVRHLAIGSVVNPMTATLAGVVAGTALYPQVSKRTYQSAMSGQPSIGSAGHDLIYNPSRIKFRW